MRRTTYTHMHTHIHSYLHIHSYTHKICTHTHLHSHTHALVYAVHISVHLRIVDQKGSCRFLYLTSRNNFVAFLFSSSFTSLYFFPSSFFFFFFFRGLFVQINFVAVCSCRSALGSLLGVNFPLHPYVKMAFVKNFSMPPKENHEVFNCCTYT